MSTGDRSAKVRTCNYPQARVTGHRIGMTNYALPDFIIGNIQEIFDALQLAEKLKEGSMVNRSERFRKKPTRTRLQTRSEGGERLR
ncbi:MAG: hypothetical protein K1X61_07730 [Chitinophagales bacterium]|nr:hypothetical protein [Chitinophagales bacterium]